MFKWCFSALPFLILSLGWLSTPIIAAEYIVVGVSGGLQDGFPEHPKMNYQDETESVQAIFLGRALVRGYKAYLDVMQEGWRQYVHDPEQPLINCNIVPTGCWHHANEYWLYAVDTRQLITILMNEPRFLSITPDLGLVDLFAAETSPVVRQLALHEIHRQNKSNDTVVAFPLVTAAWFNPTSHVPSPVLYVKQDGTQVTNFPLSLAHWAGIVNNDDDDDDTTCSNRPNDSQVEKYDYPPDLNYWDKIRGAIRAAERNLQEDKRVQEDAVTLHFDCTRKARFGISNSMARINYPFSAEMLQTILKDYRIDWEKATVTKIESPL